VGSGGGGLSCARAAIVNFSTRMGSIDDNTSGGIYAYRTSKVSLHLTLLVLWSACLSLSLPPFLQPFFQLNLG